MIKISAIIAFHAVAFHFANHINNFKYFLISEFWIHRQAQNRFTDFISILHPAFPGQNLISVGRLAMDRIGIMDSSANALCQQELPQPITLPTSDYIKMIRMAYVI